MSRLKEMYQNEIVEAMIKKFGYKNIMEVPKLDKVVINMGVGEAKDNHKVLESAVADLEKITGQKAVITKARKSVANFKIREGMAIGCKVTLRGEKMYEFVDRLVNLALPRVRDFRGVNPDAFDGRGNYALGIKEQLIFPEIEYDKIDKVRGMDVIFVTTAKTNEDILLLQNDYECLEPMLLSLGLVDELSSYDKFVLHDFHPVLRFGKNHSIKSLLASCRMISNAQIKEYRELSMLWYWRCLECRNGLSISIDSIKLFPTTASLFKNNSFFSPTS